MRSPYFTASSSPGDSWKSTLYIWDGRLTSFLQTITERPDLAALVKRIYIHSYLLKSVGNKENQEGIEQAARAAGVEEWQQLWASDLVIILISKLPNLKHFSFQTGSSPLMGLFHSHLCDGSISVFPLTTIDINTYAATNLSGYNRLFNLESCTGGILNLSKNLETLNLQMCGGIQDRAPIPALPNLKTLRVTHSRLNKKDLEGLLSSCGNLHTFVYEATETYIDTNQCLHDLGDPRDHFELSNAVRYLSRHRATLKSLHRDLRERGLDYFSNKAKASPPSFGVSDFTVLEHLFFSSKDICNNAKKHMVAESQTLVWFLPASIVSIHLEGNPCDLLPRLIKGLLGLAKAVSQGKFSKLNQIRCDSGLRLDNHEVASTFLAAGIDFNVVHSLPLSSATLPTPTMEIRGPSYSPEPMPLPD